MWRGQNIFQQIHPYTCIPLYIKVCGMVSLLITSFLQEVEQNSHFLFPSLHLSLSFTHTHSHTKSTSRASTLISLSFVPGELGFECTIIRLTCSCRPLPCLHTQLIDYCLRACSSSLSAPHAVSRALCWACPLLYPVSPSISLRESWHRHNIPLLLHTAAFSSVAFLSSLDIHIAHDMPFLCLFWFISHLF